MNKVNLTNASVTQCDFFEANLQDANLKNCSGLHSCKNLEKTERFDTYNLDECDRGWQEKWSDWEKINGFGRLKFLGISYSALALIIAFVYLIDFYNQNVVLAKSWANKVVEQSQKLHEKINDPIEIAAQKLDGNLQPLAPPADALLLLGAFVILAIASTTYQIFCPETIKEFSMVQWRYALGRPLIHYWPLSWKFRNLRVICMACYLVGAGLGIVIVVKKVWWVSWYLMEH